MARFWRIAIFAIAWSIAAASWAQSDAEIVAQGETLVRAGRYADAYKFLEPLEDRLACNLKFDYLLARAALESGQPSKASFIYERILAVEPNFVGVRLEMGRAYLALGDYARAKLEFETVLRFDNLPADLRQQAQIYGNAADQYIAGRKTVGIAYLEYGYGYDSNPQSVTRISPIAFINISIAPLSLAPPESDQYQALTMGGELIHALSDRFSVFVGGDARMGDFQMTKDSVLGFVGGKVLDKVIPIGDIALPAPRRDLAPAGPDAATGRFASPPIAALPIIDLPATEPKPFVTPIAVSPAIVSPETIRLTQTEPTLSGTLTVNSTPVYQPVVMPVYTAPIVTASILIMAYQPITTWTGGTTSFDLISKDIQTSPTIAPQTFTIQPQAPKTLTPQRQTNFTTLQ